LTDRVRPPSRAIPAALLRRRFLRALWQELRIVWPILSAIVAIQLGLGALIGRLEEWPVGDAAYFTFVTGLTIGYGDLVPTRLITRLLAILIGFCGILLAGLVAAVGVQALNAARRHPD
jgi:Ion channel